MFSSSDGRPLGFVRVRLDGATGESSEVEVALMEPDGREWRWFEEECARLLGVTDREEVVRRVTAAVPRLTGLPVSSFGGVVDEGRMVLRHTVGATAFEGMEVPAGAGLGGVVLASRRPAWVADYLVSRAITADFRDRVTLEEVHGMVVVPVMFGERMLGCLYAAGREPTALGDRVAEVLERIAQRAGTAVVVAERMRVATEIAVAEERRRLALELHDNVGAALFTIGAGIGALEREAGHHDDIGPRLRGLAEMAADASGVLRRTMSELSARPERLALDVALRRDCRAFQARTGVRAGLVVLCEPPVLAQEAVDALVRGAREALVNVEKHARASTVVVSVFSAPGRMVVAVSDDGVGLAVERVAGLGLAGASERLTRVGGDLRIGPGSDSGVTVQVWVPLQER